MIRKIKLGWFKIVASYQLLAQFPDFLKNALLFFYSFTTYWVPDMRHGSVIPAQIEKKIKFIPPLHTDTKSQSIDRKWKNLYIWKDSKVAYRKAPKLKQPCQPGRNLEVIYSSLHVRIWVSLKLSSSRATVHHEWNTCLCPFRDREQLRDAGLLNHGR